MAKLDLAAELRRTTLNEPISSANFASGLSHL